MLAVAALVALLPAAAAQCETACTAAGEYYDDTSDLCPECPAGFFCPSGTDTRSACPAGSASSAVGQSAASTCVTCTAGSYASDEGSSACTVCPAGFSCVDVAAAPVPCAAGTFNPEGSTTACQACPDSSACPAFSGTPITCNPAFGEYANADQSACDTCPDGQYLGSGDVCQDCPLGFECSDVQSEPIACDPGRFSELGDSVCRQCRRGFYCDGSFLIDCPTGMYSDEPGAEQCLPCPPGFFCAQPELSPVACPSGSFSQGNTTGCQLCPEGFACPGQASATVCPEGFYSRLGEESCSACPAGFSCTDKGDPVACLSTEYSLSEMAECVGCPAGFRCESTGTEPVLCDDGFYSLDGQVDCTPCPAGFACPSQFSDVQIACAPGSYSPGSRSNCTLCPAGHSCATTTDVPSPCLPGFFATRGSLSCTPCPIGFACPSTTQALQIPCSNGTYAATTGQSACSVCPAGAACPDPTSATETPCAAGFFAVAGQTECTPCPAGFACPHVDAAVVSPCPPGSYSNAAQQACTTCPAGSACPDPAGAPIPCDVGSYSQAGQTNCTLCPAGFECPRADLLPQPCTTNTYSSGGAAECSICSAGFICITAETSPQPVGGACPPGSYCPRGSGAISCPAGTYTNVTAATSLADCADCPEGRFCEAGTGDPTLDNTLCPAGFYCPRGTERSTEFPCPSGTYNPDRGSVSDTACLVCPSGFYCPIGSSNPSLCPTGHVCFEGTQSSRQFPCPAGTFSGIVGLNTTAGCGNCTAGNYCPAGSTEPTPCPPGFMAETPGRGSLGACSLCRAGFSCPSSGTVTAIESCGEGYYCPEGTANPRTFPCPSGTFGNSTSLTEERQCTVCPAGRACGVGTGTFNGSPQLDCAEGHYCPEGTQSPTQFPCAPGTFTAATNLVDQQNCTVCPEGSFCLGGEGAVSGPCSAGHYCPFGTTRATQFPCIPGFFTNQTDIADVDECDICPAGSYCRSGISDPTPCRSGTYRPDRGGTSQDDCDVCPAGHFCVEGAVEPELCDAGTYSDDGAEICDLCEPGYFCDRQGVNGTAMLDSPCEAGTFCPEGSDSEPNRVSDPCPAGFYCPEATPRTIPCPPGTFGNVEGGESIAVCQDCPPGQYCVGGESAISGACEPGFYCEVQSSGPQQDACPPGYYQPDFGATSFSDCRVCLQGTYCPQASVNGTECPRGSYCPTASEFPEPCPLGTFGNSTGLSTSLDCVPCPAGKFCDGLGLPFPSGLCDAGFFCIGGAFTSAPPGPPTGGICPEGGFCPPGSFRADPCPAGTINLDSGGRTAADCDTCPPGFACEGTSANETVPCDPGHFCPAGSSSRFQNAVPAGYFADGQDAAPIPCSPGSYQPAGQQASCLECGLGHYCPDFNMTRQIVCPEGTYCDGGSVQPTPCPPGTSSDRIGLFTPANGTICTPCPAGQYCGGSGLTAPTGFCLASFICFGGAASPTPVADLPFGDLCPLGSYCPAATEIPLRCPVGTFLPYQGASNLTECLDCPAGSFCGSPGLGEPSGTCSPGYYCTGGSPTATPATGSPFGGSCEAGTACPGDTPAPLPCGPGTFSAVDLASNCTTCPGGAFCDGSDATAFEQCEQGTYCVPGSIFPTLCPISTFGSAPALKSEDDCTDCPPGFYCSSPGITEVSGPCVDGFVCTGSDTVATGTGLCPAGFVCPGGVLTACPPGSYNPSEGSADISSCLACPAGQACTQPALTAPDAICEAGYYCPGNSTSAQQEACPAGTFCVTGASQPTTCRNTQYQDQPAQSSCLPCPAGFYCNQLAPDTAQACPRGFFCPAETAFANENPCPLSTYGPSLQAQSIEQCLPCPPGGYCATEGIGVPTGLCSPGYYCVGNSTVAAPTDGIVGDICPAGSYCEAGSTFFTTCRAGFYTEGPAHGSEDECLECLGGFYCPDELNDLATLPQCSGGYVCVSGNVGPEPSACTHEDPDCQGYPCPVGHECPQGSAVEVPCPLGTFNPLEQQDACFECPAGQQCPELGLTDHSDCPIFAYCPAGTGIPNDCPPGTFGTRLNQTAASGDGGCSPCPQSKYCAVFGLTIDDVDSPSCNSDGLCNFGDCNEGFICAGGSPSPSPTGVYNTTSNEGNGPCPRGHYCPEGAETPIDCPIGYFLNVTGGQSVDACIPCLGGFYCDEPGLVEPYKLCDPGYFCPSGVPNSDPQAEDCTVGAFCPAGSSDPTPCFDGTYQPAVRSESCVTCPEGFFCARDSLGEGATVPSPCTDGGYCPAGVGAPIPCPPGTFGGGPSASSVDVCTVCEAGRYCVGGRTEAEGSDGDCLAGYYCSGGSPVPRPASTDGFGNHTNGPCPSLFYCPLGIEVPLPCPEDTFTATPEDGGPGARNSTECIQCPAGNKCFPGATPLDPVINPCEPGEYCPFGVTPQLCPAGTFSTEFEATSITVCQPCPAGVFCNNGSSSTVGNFCPPGHYCPAATPRPIPCPAGTLFSGAGATNVTQCVECSGGRFCDAGSATEGACERGFYCPRATPLPVVCDGGFFCPVNSTAPVPCPIGSYCPSGADVPIDCPDSSYCPEATSRAILCPLGYQAITSDTGIRESLESSCSVCPPGTFGADPDRLSCETCPAGFVCIGETRSATPQNITSDNGFVCPAGSYCPEGSANPQACPPGTFGASSGASNETVCEPCDAGSFNNKWGQEFCFQCGSSATSEAGWTTCACVGRFRAFQPSDGSCICQPGFEFYDESLQLSEGDSDIDCQPVVYDRCGSNAARNLAGDCVNINGDYCSTVCSPESGDLLPSIGVCECSGISDPDEICDEACRASQSYVALVSNAPGFLLIVEPLFDVSIDLADIPQLAGEIDCFNPRDTADVVSCSFQSIQMLGDGGFRGLYDTQLEFFTTLLDVEVLVDTSTNTTTRMTDVVGAGDASAALQRDALAARAMTGITTAQSQYVSHGNHRHRDWSMAARRAGTARQTTVDTVGIDNPVVCLGLGEGLLFDLSSGATHYPVYLKDSLLNTNDQFDYGEFRRLEERITRGTQTTSAFAFTFSEPGVYVFADAADLNMQTIVGVVGANQQCSDDARILPLTENSLTTIGIKRNDDVLLEPDWVLIGCLLASLVLLILGFVGALYYFRKTKWSEIEATQPHYRRVGQEHDFSGYISKGSQVSKLKRYRQANEDGTEGFDMEAFENDFWDYERQIDLEGFNVKTLYDKLEDQTLQMTSQITKQKDEVKEFYDQLSTQTEQLKTILAVKLDNIQTQGLGAIGGVDMERRLKEINEEIERRRALAERFALPLAARRQALDSDQEARDAYERNQRLIDDQVTNMLSSLMSDLRDGLDGKDVSPEELQKQLATVADLIEQLFRERSREGQRRCAWSSVASPAGGVLVNASSEPVPAELLFDSNGKLHEVSGLVVKSDVTGLYVPDASARMRLENGSVVPIPLGSFCVHPATGRIVPLVGNTAVSLASGKIVFTAGIGSSELPAIGTLVPFVPDVVDQATGKLPDTALLKLAGKFPMQSRITDPASGQTVPVVAATIDPVSGKAVPIAGTMIDPVTRLLRPLERGAILETGEGGSEVVPITGVTLDPVTGKATPLGGSGPDGPIVENTRFVESLSNKQMVISGAAEDPLTKQLAPYYGGETSLFESAEMDSEAYYLASLDDLRDTIKTQIDQFLAATAGYESKRNEVGEEDTIKLVSIMADHRNELSTIRGRLDEEVRRAEVEVARLQERLETARSRCKEKFVKMLAELRRREVDNQRLYETGGVEGTVTDPKTTVEVPVLIGDRMRDRASGLWCPILGVHREAETRKVVPLAGTMADPVTGEIVPIQLAARMKDPATGKLVLITGAELDEDTGKVIPTSEQAGPAQSAKEALKLAQKEIAARNAYERRQDGRYTDIADSGNVMLNRVTAVAEDLKEADLAPLVAMQTELTDSLEAVEKAHKAEMQRRADAPYDKMGDDVARELRQADKEEEEAEVAAIAAHRKAAAATERIVQELRETKETYEAKRKELVEAGNTEGVEALDQQFAEQQKQLQEKLGKEVGVIKEELRGKQVALELAREKARLHRNEAKTIATSKATKGTGDAGAAAGGDLPAGLQNLPPETARMLANLLQMAGGAQTDPITGLPLAGAPVAAGAAGGAAALAAAQAADGDQGLDEEQKREKQEKEAKARIEKLEAMQRELEEEEQEELDLLRAQMKTAKDRAVREKKNEILSEAQNAGLTEDEKQEILQQHTEELKQLEVALDLEHVRQEQYLKERMKAKKDKKMKAKHRKEARKAAAAAAGAAPVIGPDGQVVAAAELSAAGGASEGPMSEEDIEARKQQLIAQVEKEVQEEEQRMLDELREQLQANKQTALAEKRKEMMAKVQEESVTTEDKERIMQEYKEELNNLEGTMETEKLRQEQFLKERMEKKKKKRKAKAVKKVELHSAVAAVTNEDELALMKEREMRALQVELAEETAEQVTLLAEQMERRKDELLEAKRAELEADESLTPEQRAAKLAEAEAEIEQTQKDLEAKQKQQIFEVAKQEAAKTEEELSALDLKKLRQKEELDRLNAELDAEEQEELEALRQQLVARRERETKEKKRQLMAQLAADETTAEDRERIMEEHSREVKALESNLEVEKERQEQFLKERIESKKRKKRKNVEKSQPAASDDASATKAETAEQQKAEAAADLAKEVAETAQVLEEAGVDSSEVTKALVTQADIDAEEEALRAQQEENLRALKHRHEKERQDLERKLEEEAAAEQDRILKDMEEKKKRMLDEARQRAMAEVSAQNQSLSDEESNRILKEHEAEIKRMEENLDSEKMRQAEALKAKMAQKKAKKRKAVQQKHEVEQRKEATEQTKEVQELKAQKAKEREEKVLQTAISNVDEEKKGQVIELVIAQRHGKELSELAQQQIAERAVKVREALDKVKEVQNNQMMDLLNSHEEEMKQFLASDGMSIEDMERGRVELVNKQETEVRDMEAQFAKDLDAAEKEAGAEIDAQQARARVEQRERHYRELAEATKKYVPDSDGAAEAEKAARELEELQERLKKEREDQIKELERKKKELEEETRKKMEEELARFEAEAERDRKNAESETEKALQRKKDNLLRQKEEMQQREIEEMGAMSEEQKDAILQRHKDELERLEGALDNERERQAASLQEKLMRKRDKKRRAKLKEAENQIQEKIKDAESQSKEELAKREAEKLKEAEEREKERQREHSDRASTAAPQSVAPSTVVPVAGAAGAPGAAGAAGAPGAAGAAAGTPVVIAAGAAGAAGMAGGAVMAMDSRTDDDWFALLTKSPLYQKLKEIEAMLHKGVPMSGGAAAAAAAGGGGGGGGPSYIDPKDAGWTCEGELVPLDTDNLTPMNFVAYQFGLHMIDLLMVQNRLEPVSLLVASNLPPNNYERNAFRHSFYYDSKSKTLFLRKERLDSIGELVLVLVHALSHIKVNEMTDDTNPLFLREFYRALKVCCEELFFSKTKQTGAGAALMKEHGQGANLLEHVFRKTKTKSEKANLIGELMDVRVDEGESEFSKAALAKRLEEYERYASGSKLIGFLGDLEDNLAPSGYSHIDKRLAELEGEMNDEDEGDDDGDDEDETADSYGAFLGVQVSELENKVDSITTEYLGVKKQSVTLGVTIQKKETELAGERDKLGSLKEGSDEYASQTERVQKLTNNIRKAKTTHEKIVANMEATSKRLQRYKDELAEKKKVYEQHMARTEEERQNAGQSQLESLKKQRARSPSVSGHQQ